MGEGEGEGGRDALVDPSSSLCLWRAEWGRGEYIEGGMRRQGKEDQTEEGVKMK